MKNKINKEIKRLNLEIKLWENENKYIDEKIKYYTLDCLDYSKAEKFKRLKNKNNKWIKNCKMKIHYLNTVKEL